MSVRTRLPNPLAVLDDRALLARFADQRDQPAFELLVKRHGALVFGVCRRAVRDRHLAEDAFQAVFLVLARDPARAVEAASIGGWLFGVARRVGLAARRHEHRRAKLACTPHHQGADAPRSPELQPEFDDLLRVLDEELAALPEKLRAALVACFLQERTQDETARELGWSLSTLRRRLDRGKELLRTRLARRGTALGVGLLTGAIAAPACAAVPPLAAVPSPVSAALAAELTRRAVGAKIAAFVTLVSLAVGGVALALSGGPAEPSAPVAAPAPRLIEAKEWITVSGRVVFPKDRELPKVQPVPANLIKDADAFKPFALRYEDTLVNPDNRGLANVIVFLRPDSDDRKAEFPTDQIHPDLAKAQPIDHTVRAVGGQFAPRVLAIRAGDRITFDNQLTVPTNVLYNTNSGTNFNVLLVRERTHTTESLVASNSPDSFQSNIYPWMTGYVRVFDHPYSAITDANGRFEIPNAPAGKWRLVAWHEKAGWLGGVPGRLGTKITVPGNVGPLVFESANWP